MKKDCFLLLLLLISGVTMADRYPKNPRIDVLNYAFRIQLSDSTDVIKGEATVDVRYVSDGVDVLRLDLIKPSSEPGSKGMTVSKVLSDGNSLSFTHEGGDLKITLPAPSKRDQRSAYTIIYSGSPATGLKIGNNKYGDRTFFSDNWPDKGRNWLPIIDHPYDKATCEFIVTAPAHYQVVCNGLKIEETDIAGGRRLTHWKQSVPIASWLYVLGAARFAVQHVDDFDHKAIESWVYYQDRDAGFYDFAVPSKKVLEFYNDRIGPFAYEKLANIQSNSVSGGMEAASAILYSEKSVVGDRNERWRNVIIHEIAHQWFGDAVTESDWDDVWLSEGFATYFTLLFIEHAYGRDAFLKGLEDSRKMVNKFYSQNPTYRIVHNNLEDMSQVTSLQTYQKGSWTLHMLRGVLGDDVFWKGISQYYRKHMNGNVATADFIREMEEVSGMNLERFFDQWLYKPGTLKYNGTWKYDKQKKEVAVTIDQVQADGSLFAMPLEIGIKFSDGKSYVKKVDVNEKQNRFAIQVGSEPVDVVLDPNHWVLMEAEWSRK